MLLATALLLLAGSAPADHERALELLAEQRFAEAVAAGEDEPDPVLRARVLGRVYSEARDFPAALAATRAGLAGAPGDLQLLWRLGFCGLWMQDGALAAEAVDRLERALAETPDVPSRADWEDTVRDWRVRAAAHLAREATARAALTRARTFALGAIGVLVLAIVIGGWRTGRAATAR